MRIQSVVQASSLRLGFGQFFGKSSDRERQRRSGNIALGCRFLRLPRVNGPETVNSNGVVAKKTAVAHPSLMRSKRSALSWIIGCGALCLSIQAALARDWDVVIYGGTPSGIIAGVAAAREGAAVVIVEPTRWIGGMITGGLASTDIGREATIGGMTREFFTRAAQRYDGKFLWYAEPHANMETFEAMLREAKVEVVKGQRLKAVSKAGARITGLTMESGETYGGREFIDATYEGDLMARAGVSYIVGRESKDAYGESLAGIQPMPIRPRTHEVMGSVCSCIGGTGPHYIHGTPLAIPARDAAGSLLSGVQEWKGDAGAADGLTQSYNFRLVVTQNPELRVAFPKPLHYDPAHYELLLRLIQAYPEIHFGRLVHLGKIANGKFDLNAQGLFSTDYPGANTAYPDGGSATRDRIWQDHIDYVQGFLWFLGHDPRVPAGLREETNSWGLCRDEFADNDHWPYALYVREARRMKGEYIMVQKDCQTELTKPDSVGMGSFVIDCHIVQRVATPEGNVTDEGSFPDAPARPYQIPYRSLTPRRAECENLLVPVCLSASHIACCTLRMEPVYMALGQASGLAAAVALKNHTAVQAIDVAALQNRLLAQKAVLSLPDTSVSTSQFPGIVLDDTEAVFTGDWTETSFGVPIGSGSHHDADSGKGEKTARFTVKVPHAGNYEVRFAYVPGPNRASAVPVTIDSTDGSKAVTVNEKLAPPYQGHFVSLGFFRFTPEKPVTIAIGNKATDGYVSVDAIQILEQAP